MIFCPLKSRSKFRFKHLFLSLGLTVWAFFPFTLLSQNTKFVAPPEFSGGGKKHGFDSIQFSFSPLGWEKCWLPLSFCFSLKCHELSSIGFRSWQFLFNVIDPGL